MIPLRSLSAQSQAITARGVRLWLQKNYLVSNSCLFRPPWGAAKVESSKQPGREFGGAAGPGGGGERASPRPLRRRRGASSSASLAEGALGSSGVPLLAAAAAPPAPLGGDGDQRRRRADWERPPSSRERSQGGQVGSGDRASWRMGSPRGVGQGPIPILYGGPAARAAAALVGTRERSGRGSRAAEIASRLRPPASGGAEGRGRAVAG